MPLLYWIAGVPPAVFLVPLRAQCVDFNRQLSTAID